MGFVGLEGVANGLGASFCVLLVENNALEVPKLEGSFPRSTVALLPAFGFGFESPVGVGKGRLFLVGDAVSGPLPVALLAAFVTPVEMDV